MNVLIKRHLRMRETHNRILGSLEQSGARANSGVRLTSPNIALSESDFAAD
jgi:hypothetical protein